MSSAAHLHVEDSTHWLMLDDPDALNAALSEVLA